MIEWDSAPGRGRSRPRDHNGFVASTRSFAALTAGFRPRLCCRRPEGFRPRSGHPGRCGDLACHWRSRLSFLLTHRLARKQSRARKGAAVAGESVSLRRYLCRRLPSVAPARFGNGLKTKDETKKSPSEVETLSVGQCRTRPKNGRSVTSIAEGQQARAAERTTAHHTPSL